MPTRDEVYKAVDSERDYQDKRWNISTCPSGGNHTPTEWCVYIEDYVAEAKHILSRESDATGFPKAMEIMRKVAAMAVCSMEQHGAPKRKTE